MGRLIMETVLMGVILNGGKKGGRVMFWRKKKNGKTKKTLLDVSIRDIMRASRKAFGKAVKSKIVKCFKNGGSNV